MRSPIAQQHTFFRIQRLTEIAETDAGVANDEIIEIYLVLNGQVAIAGKEFRVVLENNDLYCTHQHKHNNVVIQEGTAGYVICFNKSLLYNGDQGLYCSHFPAFEALVLRNEVIKVGASFIGDGKKICDMMYQEFNHQNDFSMQILSGYLGIFLLHLIGKSNIFMCTTGNESRHILVRKFNALLDQKFKTSKKVSDYAAMLFVTPSYLNGIIKQATGKSVGSLIRQRIVLEAVRQTKSTGATMKEVAYDLGFHDNAHFSKYFKKAAGKNFSDIRRHHFNKTWLLSTGA